MTNKSEEHCPQELKESDDVMMCYKVRHVKEKVKGYAFFVREMDHFHISTLLNLKTMLPDVTPTKIKSSKINLL